MENRKIRVGQAINQFGMALVCNYKLPPHTKQKRIVQKAANSQQLAQFIFQCIPLPSCEYMSCKHGHSVATSIVEATQCNAMPIVRFCASLVMFITFTCVRGHAPHVMCGRKHCKHMASLTNLLWLCIIIISISPFPSSSSSPLRKHQSKSSMM